MVAPRARSPTASRASASACARPAPLCHPSPTISPPATSSAPTGGFGAVRPRPRSARRNARRIKTESRSVTQPLYQWVTSPIFRLFGLSGPVFGPSAAVDGVHAAGALLGEALHLGRDLDELSVVLDRMVFVRRRTDRNAEQRVLELTSEAVGHDDRASRCVLGIVEILHVFVEARDDRLRQ